MKGISSGFLPPHPSPAGRRREGAGFTLFELIIVIVIVSFLAAVLFDRVRSYQELAEKAAMEQTAGVIRSALNLQVAERVAKGSVGELTQLARENPMNWLADRPKNYLGEYYDPRPGDVPRGNWYFDLRNRHLVYLVQKGEYFAPGKDDRKWVRYRVSLVYNRAAQTGAAIEGVVLETIEAYTWGAG